MAIKISGIEKSFDGTKVLQDINIEVEKGEFVSIVGPSGCGKSTLLNIVAGSVQPDIGTVEFDGNQDISYVFQSPRLLDWRTVERNLELVLEANNIPSADHDELISKSLNMVGLSGDIRQLYPPELSGGMQSRVALVRGLIVPRDIVLMDEPLGDIDEITAREIRIELENIVRNTDKTILYVTHNVSEAAYLSDRILLMGNKPTPIIHDINIDLSRPRDPDNNRIFEIQNSVYKNLP